VAKSKLLYKYLDAGAKGSAVVIDTTLDTCKEQTIYLYHQLRDEIIEFRRDIVEPKLRELTGEDAGMEKALEEGYQKVRSTFMPRGGNALNIARHVPPVAAPEKLSEESELEDDADFNMEFDD